MSRIGHLALVALVALACNCSKSADKATSPPPVEGEKIKVPVGDKAVTVGGSQTDDPKLHLHPDEGTLTIAKAEGKAGSEETATLKVTPASGFHVSTDFPSKLTLDPPAGVKLAKAELVAGKGDKGDADAFSEQALVFAVKATADKAGAYEIKGMFKFGVCDKDSCHPKKQPITITVDAS